MRIDRGEREAHAQSVERDALGEVGAETMLFVLGEDRQHARVEIEALEVVGRRLRSGGELLDRADEALDVEGADLGVVRQESLEALDAFEEDVEDLLSERDLAEPERVERVLERVRERRRASQSRTCRRCP